MSVTVTNSSIQADRETLAALRTERFHESIESIRDYVACKAIGETSEPEQLLEVENALDLLKKPPQWLEKLVKVQISVNANRELYWEDYETLSRETEAERIAAQKQVNKLQAALTEAKTKLNHIAGKQSAQVGAHGEVGRMIRGNPVLFGSTKAALADLFPPAPSMDVLRRGGNPNGIPQSTPTGAI